VYKKKLISIIFIFLIFNNTSLCLENKILAKVDQEIVTSIDVDNEAKYLILLNPNIKNLSKKEIFDISKNSIIREKVKYIEINKNFKNLNVPDEYIEPILKNIYQKIGIDNLENFQRYLKENSIDYEYVKDKIEIETLWNELIFVKFSSKILINKEEIKKRLISEVKQYSKSYMVSEIFFEASGSDQVENIYKKIVKTIENDGFDNAVLSYSSSNTANSGGQLGWIGEEALNENLRNILNEMNEGEYTKPITVPAGFLVLKIDQIKKEKINQNIEKKIDKIINVKKMIN
jgi:peptidyl-prolyl cis-trans isomerase SurA